MATFTILAVLAVTAASSMAISEEELHEMIHGMAANCEEVYPITEEDAELLHNHQSPTGPNGACFLTCMFERLGMMENGEFKAAHAKETVRKFTAEQPEVQEKMENLLEICEGQVGTGGENCKAGMQLFTCFKTHAESVGFMPDA